MTDRLREAARIARNRGVTADEAMRVVAEVYGALFNKEGRIDGWKPDAKPVRELPKPKQTDEVPDAG